MDYSNDKISKANNKEIYTTSAEDQKTKVVDCENLKKAGLKGDELINEIVASNSSMSKRTLLSQEKILKRMEIRHKYQFFIAKPTILNLTECLFLDKYISKAILHLRFDSICTILQKCKFLNQSKTLIFDETNGFMTSILTTRASGPIFSLYEGRPYQRMISYFNLSAKQKANITYFELNKFGELASSSNEKDFISFNQVFTNLIVCIREQNRVIEIVRLLVTALKSSGSLIVYARDKEVSPPNNIMT